jgi:hypothetical protein
MSNEGIHKIIHSAHVYASTTNGKISNHLFETKAIFGDLRSCQPFLEVWSNTNPPDTT